MVRITDRPDMTSGVYCEQKATNKTCKRTLMLKYYRIGKVMLISQTKFKTIKSL